MQEAARLMQGHQVRAWLSSIGTSGKEQAERDFDEFARTLNTP
jgi:hypothetical protein